ncbi:50S ribosomal protein L25/general stress protein Ctc [Citricoccus sp. NR2]|uniref:50S ribosomal protein L25/general stress protein Ctc n=1 Tax=Citricoccus sp. NR2 TaxID=3004095 RepID=UPI0022DE8D62|nr:50S ribosomal protein L25/general stress protein Ctc [Citricoccus sp. NR2]WBL18879.1 50S ribosomal protein L25/general stress protein Ctc [Citricoccus sp. NR2]
MSDRIKLQVETRDDFGKGASRRARREGKIPAVIYGHGTEPKHILMPGQETFLAVRNPNALLTLVNGGEETMALPKDVQRDPLKDTIDHIDLLIVRKGEKVTVDVYVEVEGEVAPGAIHNLEEVTVPVEADALKLPERVTVSVEGREPGEHLHTTDVVVDGEGEVLLEEDHVIVTVNEVVEQDLGEETEDADAAEGEEVAEGKAAEGEESGESAESDSE